MSACACGFASVSLVAPTSRRLEAERSRAMRVSMHLNTHARALTRTCVCVAMSRAMPHCVHMHRNNARDKIMCGSCTPADGPDGLWVTVCVHSDVGYLRCMQARLELSFCACALRRQRRLVLTRLYLLCRLNAPSSPCLHDDNPIVLSCDHHVTGGKKAKNHALHRMQKPPIVSPAGTGTQAGCDCCYMRHSSAPLRTLMPMMTNKHTRVDAVVKR